MRGGLRQGLLRVLAAVAISSATVACAHRPAPVPYRPGLGEIMTHMDIRHEKLWFAGTAKNWALAAYFLKEIREGLHASSRFHPTHEGASGPIPDLIARIMGGPLDELEQTIRANDGERFSGAFDGASDACNSCHQATNFGFIVVARPGANPPAR